MASKRTLTFNITTEDEQTIKALRKIQRELGKTEGSVRGVEKSGASLSSHLGNLAVGAGALFAVNEWDDAEKTARKMDAAIRATGNSAHVSADEQRKLADTLGKTAAVDNDVVIAAGNRLRVYRKITDAKFGETLAASLDLAAAKEMDLNSATELLGKALNDPVAGMAKLRRAGVVLSEQQQDQVKAFVAMGDTASAQGIILEEVAKRYGGAAKANATDTDRMKVAAADAAESVGAILAPALGVAADAASTAADALGKLPKPVQEGTVGLLALAYAGPKVWSGLQKAKEGITSMADGLSTLPAKGANAASSVGDLASTAMTSPAAMAAGAAGVGALTIAMIEMSDATARAKANADGLVQTAEATGESIDTIFNERLAKTIAGLKDGFDIGDSGKFFRDELDRQGISANQLSDALTGSDEWFKVFRGNMLESARDAGFSGSAIGLLEDDLNTLRGSGQQAKDSQKDLAKAQHELGVETQSTADKTRDATTATDGASAAQEDSITHLGNATTAWAAHADQVARANKETRDNLDMAQGALGASTDYQSAVLSTKDAADALNEARKGGDAEDIRKAELNLTSAIQRQTEAADKLYKAQADVNGAAYDGAQSAQVIRNEYEKARKTTGYWSDDLQHASDQIEWFGAAHKVNLDTDDAKKKLFELIQLGQIATGQNPENVPTPGGQQVVPPTRNPDAGPRSGGRNLRGGQPMVNVTMRVQNLHTGPGRRAAEAAANTLAGKTARAIMVATG